MFVPQTDICSLLENENSEYERNSELFKKKKKKEM